MTEAPGPVREDFGAFAAREHGNLLRLAVLLSGDPDDAADLTRSALVRVRARWHRPTGVDPATAARAAVVRGVLSGRDGGPRTSGWVPDGGRGTDVHDDVRRALGELPAPARVAVVLAVWGDRPGPEVAALLRRPEDAVREEVAGAVALLAAVRVPATSSWWTAPTGRSEPRERVRLALSALAEADLPQVSGEDLAAGAGDAVRTRRRRGVLAGIAALGAVVVVAVPALTGGEPDAPQAAVTERPVRPAPAAPGPVDLAELPVRGSLAGDSAFVDAVRDLPWEAPLTGDFDVPILPGTRRVLYAGDVPGGRWALVVAHAGPAPAGGSSGGPVQLSHAWFTGPPGAGPDRMELAGWPYLLEPGATPALSDPRTGTLVVVAHPGDDVDVSRSIEIDPEGTGRRIWEPAAVSDGTAVSVGPPADVPWTWTTLYRVVRSGVPVRSATPDVIVQDGDGTGPPRLDIRYPGGTPAEQDAHAAESAAWSALATVGAAGTGATITARALRRVDGPTPGTLAVVTFELPGGPVVVSVQYGQRLAPLPGEPDDAGSTMIGDCGLDVLPAGRPAADRVLAARCERFDPIGSAAPEALLVVAAPPSVAAVRTYGPDGRFVAEHEVVDGFLVVPDGREVETVEALTGSGVQLGRVPLLSFWEPES